MSNQVSPLMLKVMSRYLFDRDTKPENILDESLIRDAIDATEKQLIDRLDGK